MKKAIAFVLIATICRIAAAEQSPVVGDRRQAGDANRRYVSRGVRVGRRKDDFPRSAADEHTAPAASWRANGLNSHEVRT